MNNFHDLEHRVEAFASGRTQFWGPTERDVYARSLEQQLFEQEWVGVAPYALRHLQILFRSMVTLSSLSARQAPTPLVEARTV